MSRNARIGLIVGVVMVLVVIAGFAATRLSDDSGELDLPAASSTSASPSAGESAGADAAVNTPTSVAVGPADAPHQIIIFEDFLCPFCGDLEAETADELAQLAADGHVRVEYRPFELLAQFDYSGESLEVFAGVLLQGDQEVAKAVHDRFFDEQPSESGPFPSQDDLIGWAVEEGADETALRAALEDGSAEDVAERATQEAVNAGVRGTPTIALDGQLFQDGRTVEELAANLIAAVSP